MLVEEFCSIVEIPNVQENFSCNNHLLDEVIIINRKGVVRCSLQNYVTLFVPWGQFPELILSLVKTGYQGKSKLKSEYECFEKLATDIYMS